MWISAAWIDIRLLIIAPAYACHLGQWHMKQVDLQPFYALLTYYCCVQTPVRTNDLLNALQYILQPCNSRELAQAFPGLLLHRQSAAIDHSASQRDEHGEPAQMHSPKESASQAEGSSGSRLQKGLLAGDDYYAAKEQLITDEQILLRILCFEITVEHPHKYLLNLCSVLQCEKPLIQLALCLVRHADTLATLNHPTIFMSAVAQ